MRSGRAATATLVAGPAMLAPTGWLAAFWSPVAPTGLGAA